jgi:gliding motility-associated-like protein
MNIYKLLLFFTLFTSGLMSQNILISQGGTVNVSGGETFYDAGGAAGNDGNTSYTITLCPATVGYKVALNFTFFETYFYSDAFTNEKDMLNIHNGNSIAASNIGSLTGNYSQRFSNGSNPFEVGSRAPHLSGNRVFPLSEIPDIFSPTIFTSTSADGCITLRFVNGSIQQGQGWVANISLYKPADLPGCNIDNSASKTTICPGETSILTISGSVTSNPISNNFNNSTLGNGWQSTAAASFNSTICGSGSLDGSTFLWMQNSAGPRTLETINFNLTNGGTIGFDYRQPPLNGSSPGSPCEAPDHNSTYGSLEGIYLQYSTDNGSNWNLIKFIFPSATNISSLNGCGNYVHQWSRMEYPIPAGAMTANTRFRWHQAIATSASTDNWGLDNVLISTTLASTITLTNLSTNQVLTTSTTSPFTFNVSPTSTTTYRATITDGTTSCYDDVTINVNATPATTIAYPSLSVANTVTAAQNITLTNGPVTGNYTATPTGLDINVTTGAVIPSTSAIGTYTISVPTACGTATTTLAVTAVPCGSCALPNCPIFHNTSATTGSAIVSYPVCTTLSPVLTSGSFQTCYQVTTNANGNLGFRLSEDIRQNPLFQFDLTKQCNALRADAIDATRSYTLIQSGSGCPGTPIPPNATNVVGSAIGFNPEWYGLLPNTNYTLCVTVSVPDNSCQLERLCMVYYHPNASCTTCATATCPATSITATTAALGQSGISTALTSAGNQLNISLINGQSATVCVPVTVPSGSTILGFKHSIDLSSACAINNVTYQLKPASNCSGSALLPNRVNAQSVSSGFNPEWDNLTAGNYVLCYTISVTNAPTASCNGLPDINGEIKSIDLLGLGYYNVIPPSCSTCATATCNVASITVATAPLGQTGIVTAIAAAGNNLGLSPLTAGQSVTVCVPVTVVANSTMLGFKQQFDVQMECLNPAIQVINYQLRPASNCNATPIVPNRTNASSTSSGFNPEWDNLPVGNYVLCYTLNIVSISTTCNPVNLHGLGYYNVVPVPCNLQDYQIQLYDDIISNTKIVHSGTTFACSDPGVYLGPVAFPTPTQYNSDLPYPMLRITVTPILGNLNNLELIRYDASNNTIAEVLTVPTSGISINYFLRPAPGQYYKLDKTNGQSGTYSYTIVDVISGLTVASGTWTITAGAESAASITLVPQGTAEYLGPGVTDGFDQTGVHNYTNDRGIGFFNPSVAGVGTHTITYTWNNGLAAPNNCTLTRTKIVTVTGPSAPTSTNVSICSGTTATLTAAGLATGAIVKWYNASSGGTAIFTGNPFTTPILTAATSYWVTQTRGGCESSRVKVDVIINPIVTPTISCGSSTINSVQFTWPAVAGATSFTATHTINGGASVNDGTITSPFTISGLNPNDAVAITLTPVGGSGTCFGSASLTCTANACPTILTPSANQTLCLGDDPTSLSVSTTFTGSNTISFIYFNSQQTGSVMYTGGTLLGNATPSSGTASYNPGVLGTPGSLPNTAGTYFVYAIANPTPAGTTCRPFQEIRVVVNSTPLIPTVTTTAATCLANGTATVSNYSSTENYTSTPVGLTVSSTGVISGFTCGTAYTITATNVASCSATSTSFTVQCQLAAPLVPTVTTTAATCLANGTATVSNYSSTENYTSAPAGLTVNATGVISGLTCGTAYTITATNVASCSATSTSFTVQCQIVAPLVPTITTTPATCLVNGTATVSNYSSTETYTSTPTGLTVSATGLISGFTCGTAYTITATNVASCSATSTSFTVQCQIVAPLVPTVTTTAATCLANGTATVSNYSSTENYTSTPVGLTVSSTGVISGFTCGTAYTITATNVASCSATSTSFTVQCQLAAPLVPTVTTTAATCLANGTATVSNYSAALNYTSTPVGLTVSSTGVISGFTCGTAYTITATNVASCSATSTSFTVQCQLVAPLVPMVTTTAATCLANGTASVSNYSAALNYTSTPVGLTVSATGVISGFTCGTAYTISATNSATCSATSTSFTVQCQLVAPLVPTVTTTAATCLANGTATVSNYSSTENYTSTPAGLTVSATGVISGFTCGTAYTITATNVASCSATSTNFTVQCQLVAPFVPTVTTTAATCSQPGSSTIINYNAALTYIFTPSGPIVSSAGLISGMTAGSSYTVTSEIGGCISLPSASFSINAITPIPPTFNPIAPVCQGATINLPTSSTNTPPIVGVWNLISSSANDVTYGFTPNSGQCALTTPATTMTIVVHPLPTVTPSVMTQSFCSGGTTNINLTSNVPGSAFYWTATGTSVTGQSGSVTGSGATSINQTLVLNANQVAAGQVTYVIVAEANGCLGAPVTVVVTVKPIPNVIVSPASLAQTICSGQATNISFSGAINNTVYSWSVLSSVGVSGALNGSGASINQTLTTTGTSQGTVVYEVTPSLNGCTGTPKRITVTVNPVPEIFGSATHPDLCSGERPTSISVSTFNAATVYNWVVVPVGVSGASAGTDSGLAIVISQLLTTTGTTRGYVDYIITPVLTGCPGLPITVRVYVNPLPVVSLTDGTICVNAAGVPFQTYELDSGLNDVDYDFVWTFGGVTIPGATSATYTATQVGTYSVVATNSTTNCVSNVATAVVTPTIPATGLTITQSEFFSDYATITVNVIGGTGTLLYQLDDGVLQESNVFTEVSGGKHIITVVDTQGCTYLTKEVMVIDYPKYFTPNGDGINDTWNIKGLNQPDAKIFIFDRYGKLIKQITPTETSQGWDGTYIGSVLPSTDYWFTIEYKEKDQQKLFKAHFALKK